MKQRSQEWFEARKGKITSSRIGAILGRNPYKNRNDIMREMVREHFNLSPEFTGNNATQWGEDNEEKAIEQYELEKGKFVIESGLVVHPAHDFIAGSPDGLIDDDGIIEVKCPFSRKIKPITEMPHYFVQVQTILACTQRKWCDYVVWTPETMVIERVFIQNDFINANLSALEGFINEYRETIGKKPLYEPFLGDKEVTRIDKEWLTLAGQYAYNDALIKSYQDEQKQIKKALLDEAGEIKTSGGGITVFPSFRTCFDEKKLMADYPEIDLSVYRKKSKSPVWQVRLQAKK